MEMKSQQKIDALNFELKFIAFKMDSMRERKHNLARQHVELSQELEDMERHYERTAKVLDEISEPKIEGEWVYKIDGEPLKSEYGSSGQVGILPGTLKNNDGEEMNCACGNPGIMMIAGWEAFQVFCHNCANNFGHKHNLNMDLDKPRAKHDDGK